MQIMPQLGFSFLVILLFGAAPIPEGTELTILGGGGQYQNTGCSSAKRFRHTTAVAALSHEFKDSGWLVRGELGGSEIEQTAQTSGTFSSNQGYEGAALVRVGYQGRWGAIEIGPYVYSNEVNPVLPSLLGRFNLLPEFYVYTSFLESPLAGPFDVFGLGTGVRYRKVLVDISLRGGDWGKYRLESRYDVTQRWGLGTKLYYGPRETYQNFSGFLVTSFHFGEGPKRYPGNGPQPAPPESTLLKADY